MKKNGIFTFCFAFIPGAGEMYLGYMKRGVSIMALFCAISGVAIALNLGVLAIALPVLWAYAFFDTFNLRAQTDEQAAQNPDAYWIDPAFFMGDDVKKLLAKRHNLIGWGLIAIGVYSLYSNLVRGSLWNFFYHIDFTLGLAFLENVPTLVVAGLIIWLGVMLLRGEKRQKTNEQTEEYIAFKGDNTHE
ncbi:MAG: hypothetical protein RSF70_07315 [Ruthenibacterium sp.]